MWLFDDLDYDINDACFGIADANEGSAAQINYATAYKRAAVVNPNNDTLATVGVGHFDPGTKSKLFMGSGKGRLIKTFAAGCCSGLELIGIKRCLAGLLEARRGRGVAGRAAGIGKKCQCHKYR